MRQVIRKIWDFICARDRKAEALRDITCDCCPHYYESRILVARIAIVGRFGQLV